MYSGGKALVETQVFFNAIAHLPSVEGVTEDVMFALSVFAFI